MDFLYKISLLLHSWNRWAILIFGIAVIVFAIKGLNSGSKYNNTSRKSMFYFILSLHLQLLVGLLLYFVLSPVTSAALNDFGAAMKDGTLRYWAVEHAFVNILAIAVAQTGSIIVRKRTNDRDKHRLALIWTIIAMVLIIAMIPMGMMGVERPWFRF
ncbi:MAG: hypothetical protein HGA37_05995 [Lentimicrobium sp.]|nr:hypothetical protein [Lentimicrobium sp.]